MQTVDWFEFVLQHLKELKNSNHFCDQNNEKKTTYEKTNFIKD